MDDNSGEEKKTEEEAEKEFPTFKNQLKWTLISDKIAGKIILT
jgi:trigger factor